MRLRDRGIKVFTSYRQALDGTNHILDENR